MRKLITLFLCLIGALALGQNPGYEERVMANALGHVLDSHRGLTGCAALLSTTTGEVIAKTGDIELRRDPGSTLKPFLFAMALDQGRIVPDTILQDTPMHLEGYDPQNYDGRYRGPVTAQEALFQSLNIPAVRLLQEITPESFLHCLEELTIIQPDNAPHPSLGMATGGFPVGILPLSRAYAALYNGHQGVFRRNAGAMVLKMLRTRPLPNAGALDIAWKTGTSAGNRDAWCLAVTPDWTLCVWFGYSDHSSSGFLEGRALAAPVAGEILTALYQELAPSWPTPIPGTVALTLCARSGLTPTTACPETTIGVGLQGVVPLPCPLCGKPTPPEFLAPAPGVYRTRPDGMAWIQVRLSPEDCALSLNGTTLRDFHSGDMLTLPPGEYLFQAQIDGEPPLVNTLEIRVK